MPVTRRRLGFRPILAAALAVCGLGLLAVVFLPIGWQLNRFVVWLYYALLGVRIPVTLEGVDTGLNIALFAVPTVLAALLWPRVRWWIWPLLMLIASTGIELIQLVALPRDASVWDVLANTSGALLGAGLVALLRAARTHRRR